jgi:DNA recombination protein RmuC
VLSTARKFEDLQAAAENTSLPELEPIERAPRLPAAVGLLEPADDFAFTPDPRESAHSAASDLRSALEV